MADPAMLLASDHTEIMKFLIQNYHLVLPKIHPGHG